MTASVFLLFFLLSAASHPFYLSVTEIDYNTDNQSLEVSIKLFTDNLNQALIKQGNSPETAGETTDIQVQNYLKEKLVVTVNGKPVEFEFLGKEVLPDVTWCYLEGKNIPAIKNIKVKNLMLLEVFDSQKNIVHLDIAGRKKSLLLQRGKVEEELAF
ncbi:MAG: DUF6702 family protein [Bacteroidia bacterium]